MYYIGKEFDKANNEKIRTKAAAIDAALANCTRAFDADGAVVADYTTELSEPAPAVVTEAASADAPEAATETANADAPEGTTEAGNCGPVPVRGKIRKKFSGVLRVRRSPSWDSASVAGVTNFCEKKVVAIYVVDGRKMYETADGYFVSGDPAHVEFIAE